MCVGACVDYLRILQTTQVTTDARLRPLPFRGHEPGRESALAPDKVDHSAADAHPRWAPGGFAHEPEEGLSLAEGLIGEVRIAPDAPIDRKDAALAHSAPIPQP